MSLPSSLFPQSYSFSLFSSPQHIHNTFTPSMRALAAATPLHSSTQIHCQFNKTSLKFQNPTCLSSSSSSSTNNCSSLRFPTLLAQGRSEQNVSGGEDADEVFDELLRKHGKVVYRSGDQKPPAAEVDDDAESLSFAVAIAKVASDVKAGDIRVLFVKPLVYWTRFFIIATAFSRPQIDAIGSRIRDTAEKQFKRVASGDTKPNSWTLLDFGDVVVHIFLPPQRAFYNLEEFYGNATTIELPFDTQSSFRN